MRTVLVIVAIVLCSVILSEAFVFQRKGKNDDVNRTLKIVATDSRLEVTAVRNALKKSQRADAIDFVFDTNWLPRFVLRYFHVDTDSADKLAARWAMWKIVEYVDNGTAPGFDPQTDTILSDVKFWVRGWTKLTDDKETLSDGTVIHNVCSNAKFVASPHPDVTLCAELTDKRASVTKNKTAVAYDPNSLKWSLSIANYPYVTTDSNLALKVSFDSRSVVKTFDSADDSDYDVGSGESAIDLGGDNTIGARAIAAYQRSIDVVCEDNSATTGSISSSVIYEGEVSKDVDGIDNGNDTDASLQFVGKHKIMYLSFITGSGCQAKSILWDPQFGVDTGAGVALLPSLLLLLAALLSLWM